MSNRSVSASRFVSEAALALAQESDPDRFFCAMFLPEPARAAAFTLIAFNNEISRALAPAVSSEIAGSLAGYVRLQWWRDIVAGSRFPHEVATPLGLILDEGLVSQATLLRMIDAREAELAGLLDDAAWTESLLNGAGALQRAFGEIAGIDDLKLLEGLQICGAAYGTGSLLRHLPAILRSGRHPLPAYFAVAEDEKTEVSGDLVAWLQARGEAFLLEAEAIVPPDKHLLALPMFLARRDLKRPPCEIGYGNRGTRDRLSIALTGLRAKARFRAA